MNLDFLFKIKVLIFSDKLNSPQNSTEKTETQICNARRGGSPGGLARFDLVLEYSSTVRSLKNTRYGQVWALQGLVGQF